MKVIEEKDMSPHLKKMLDIAEELAMGMCSVMSSAIIELLNTNPLARKFSYRDTIIFLQKIKVYLFLGTFETSIDIVKQFPDADFNTQEIFEWDIECLRLKTGFKQENHDEYTGGIKKIKVED